MSIEKTTGTALGLHRRTVLAGAATTATAAALVGGAATIPTATAGERGDRSGAFLHGVASGDPTADSVVIWTRLTPTPDATPGSGKGPRSTVLWEVAKASDGRVIEQGRVSTGPDRDHTVKVDVTGLEPATSYVFRFTHAGRTSPVGRTRTAPRKGLQQLRFGVVSCSNYDAGYFSPYRHLAEREDLDAVLHLGDYLYEYENGFYGEVRSPEPAHEIVSLADYRQRHASYKQDPDLMALHARVPFVAVWDDHEVANNSWREGAENHDDATEGDYGRRKARAHRAYDEWMPVRLDGTARLGDGTRLFRTVRYGDLADLVMLDLRSYRDLQAKLPNSPDTADPERTLLGDRQMAWLKKQLSASDAAWKLVGNSVIISPLGLGGLPRAAVDALEPLIGPLPQDATANTDQWDGYTADRRELLDHIEAEGVEDVVFLTGDVHTSWAMEVPVEAGTYPVSGTAGVEFVITSVTSPNLDSLDDPDLGEVAVAGLQASNRHIKYLDGVHHGYGVLTLTAEAAQMDFYVVSDRLDPEATVSWQAGWLTARGTGALTRADGPVS